MSRKKVININTKKNNGDIQRKVLEFGYGRIFDQYPTSLNFELQFLVNGIVNEL